MCYQIECLYYLQKLLQWKLLHDDNDWLEVSIPLSIVYGLINLCRFEVSISCDSHCFRKWVCYGKKMETQEEDLKEVPQTFCLFHKALSTTPVKCTTETIIETHPSFSIIKKHRNALDTYGANQLQGLKSRSMCNSNFCLHHLFIVGWAKLSCINCFYVGATSVGGWMCGYASLMWFLCGVGSM